MIEIILKKEGFSRIATALTGKEAIDLVKNNKFDLIVLDVMLPTDLDGFECCRQLRQFTTAPILFVTARSSDLDKLMGLGIIHVQKSIILPFIVRSHARFFILMKNYLNVHYLIYYITPSYPFNSFTEISISPVLVSILNGLSIWEGTHIC